jgi:OOP family OmpA-OmpF porin
VKLAVLIGGLAAASPALAVLPIDPPPGAAVTWTRAPRIAVQPVPTAPVTGHGQPVATLEGLVEEQVWRLATPAPSSLEAARAAEARLVANGYERVFDCAAPQCGGFDFRFALPLAAAPAMEVDLGDFHYTVLRRGDADYVTLFASKAGLVTFLQVATIAVGAAPPPPPPAGTLEATEAQPVLVAAPEPGDFAAELREAGRAVLRGIDFAPGRADLLPGADAALADLAGILAADPGLRVAIVGHTDATGALEANVALSRKRAETVREALVAAHGADAARLTAQGVGPLAPRAANDTEENRALNRRVEVVVLP